MFYSRVATAGSIVRCRYRHSHMCTGVLPEVLFIVAHGTGRRGRGVLMQCVTY